MDRWKLRLVCQNPEVTSPDFNMFAHSCHLAATLLLIWKHGR